MCELYYTNKIERVIKLYKLWFSMLVVSVCPDAFVEFGHLMCEELSSVLFPSLWVPVTCDQALCYQRSLKYMTSKRWLNRAFAVFQTKIHDFSYSVSVLPLAILSLFKLKRQEL